MAYPVADTYAALSGNPIAGGRQYVSQYYRDLATGWTELVIPGTKPGAGLLAYSGMALDEVGGKIIAIGGGHQDASADEPWVLDIEARAGWEQAYLPYFGQNPPLASAQAAVDNVIWPGAIVIGGQPAKPISRHTYKSVHWIDSLQRMVVGGGSTYSGSGSDYLWLGQPGGGAWLNDPRDFWTYDPVSKDWDYKGSYHLNSSYAVGGITAYHKQRDLLFGIATNGNNSLTMRWWNPQTNVWTQSSSWAAGTTSTYSLICVDTMRDRLIIVSRKVDGSAEVYEYNIDTDTFTALPSTGAVPPDVGTSGNIVYSSKTDRVLLLTSAAEGLQIYDRATGVWSVESVGSHLPNLLQTEGRWRFDHRRGVAFLVYSDAGTVRVFAYKE